MQNTIKLDDVSFYMHGANYPWMVKNGKSNYGLDFGVNRWGTHHGVTTNRDQVEKDFAVMRDLGFSTLRWFVFTDGRGGIRFGDDGMPVAPAEKFFEDMDAVVSLADEYGLKLILVLLDFLWMQDLRDADIAATPHHAHILLSHTGQDELIGSIFHPVFRRYAQHPSVLAWEVMNEPDWVVGGLDVDSKKVSRPISMALFKSFIRKVSNAVHDYAVSKVTVGGGRIKYIHVWDDDDLQLDFLQVHTYNDFLNHPWDERLFGKRFSEMNLRRPLLIGEFSTNAGRAFKDNRNTTEIPLSTYLDFGLKGGYAGCLYWSFNAVDECGREDVLALGKWVQANTFA